MDINTFVCLSVLCMWCSLYAGRSPLIVTAQSQLVLSAEILTPEAERKEGGRVQMNCTTNFDVQNFTLEWQKDNITLRQDEETVTSDPRFNFVTGYEMNNTVITKQLIITGVHRDDSGMYTCNLIDKRGAFDGNIVGSVHETLSVLYFPSESFPICSPAGNITAVAGTELNLQCSSEVGNPQVMMEIYQSKYNDTFTLSHHGDMISMSLSLIANVDYNNVQFLCTITSPMYYPSMSPTCIIGPINVNNVSEPATTSMTESTQTSPTSSSNNTTMKVKPTPPQKTSHTTQSNDVTTISPLPGTTNPAIIAGAVTAGVIVIVLISIIILILLYRRRSGLCIMKQSSGEDNTPITNLMTTALPSQRDLNEDDGLKKQNSEANMVASLVPEPSSSHSGTTLPRRAEVPDSSLIYAKPQKATVVHQDNKNGITNITEQSYINPVFDSKSTEDAKRPYEDHPKVSIKPVANVKPNMNVPKKLAPFRPKSDRTSNTHDNPITSPSQEHTEPSSGHPQDGRQETSSPPLDVTYAQVSVPIRQNSRSSQKLGDDITYAELDMTSHTTQDDRVTPSSSAIGAAIYATVTKTKQK